MRRTELNRRRTDPPDLEWTLLDKAIVALAVGAIVLAIIVVGASTDPAGAETRPDYQNLGACAPDVARHDHGVFAYTVPTDCAIGRWHHATFDLAPFAGRHELGDQTLVCDVSFTIIDGEARGILYQPGVPGGCDTATLTVNPPGTYLVQLDLGTCGTQQDMWADGDDQPYAVWVQEDEGCGATLGPAVPDSSTAAPTIAAVEAPEAQGATPATGASDGEESETLSLVSGSAPAPPVASNHAAALPVTGVNVVTLIVLGVCLALGGLLALVFCQIRKYPS